MKKLYSLVLMATALLIGTNVWAKTHVAQIVGGVSYETLNEAFAAAQAAQGDQTIVMLENDTITKPIDFGKAKSLAEYTAAHKVVTLDFKGKTVTMDVVGATSGKKNNIAQNRMFNVYSGALKLVNSTPAAGGGLHHTYNSGKYYTILVFGSIRKDCDPSEDKEDKLGYYTYLSIGEGVNIVSDGENGANGGICVMIMPNGTNSVTQNKTTCAITATTAPQVGGAEALAGSNIWNGYNTCGSYIYTNDYKFDDTKACGKKYSFSDPRGVANGVRIDVYGHLEGSLYAMQSNGQLAGPDDKYKESDSYYNTYKNTFYGDKIPAEVADISDNDKKYAPYIHIHQGAVLKNKEVENDALKPKQVALYTSGYARWYVEGECSGTTGLYMKSGDVTLKNATISSSFEGTATNNSGQTIGVSGEGNAVVVESNDHYSGHLSLTIEGDTKVETPATGGTALLETIATGSDPEVEHININGGTLTGENAIVISDATAEEKVVTIAGSNLDGAVDPSTLTEIISNGSHATTVGNTTVISTGAAPDAEAGQVGDWATIKGKEGQNVKWNVAENASIESGTITFGELQIVSGTTGNLQQLTIKKDAALVVDKLIMNDYARIIVEAGGMLIVTGTLGINAPVFENILLKSTATEQATFLFNPAVSSNKYPKATVQLTSKAYKIGDNNYAWQRFAVPTHVGYEVKRNDMQYDKTNYPTAIYKRVYSPDGWEVLAPASEEAYVPFLCYNMTTNVDHVGAVYTFQCEMAGNVNAELPLLGEKWSYYGNSYTAPIDLATMIPSLPATVSKTVYVHNVGEDYWDAVNVGDIEDNEMAQTQINPMQAFVYQKRGEGTSTILDYENWVYEPAKVKANLAPARRVSSSVDYQRATIVMTAEDGSQEIAKLYQGARFANTYDDGYDAEKLMSENHFNMYINAEEGEMTRWATDEIENATINMQTKQATSYTMSFKNVTLEGYAVKDNLTGTTVEIMNGNTYHFSTLANANVEGRFEIVGRQNMPTAIDNTEAVKSVKGIYTITGQYVGEENVWNTLPAGVYVVNGMKMVK